MTHFSCPYLQSTVELSDERERHIADTLIDPDQVRRSARFGNARLFTRRLCARKSCQTASGSAAR
jgi:hypothetical protein